MTDLEDNYRRVGLAPSRPEWPSLGWVAIEWVEAYLCHGPGDILGAELVLDDEMAQFLVDAYRLYPKGHPKAGRRIVTDATLSRPKGRAKSELAGAVVCLEALGPARFDGWDASGEPVGIPVVSPMIRCLATEEGQSGNTYENVTAMLEHAAGVAPELFGQVDTGLTRTFLGDGGEIRPSTASGAAKDGGKETFAVADETHLYKLAELHQMHAVVSRNLTKRQAAEPWLLNTSTMFAAGEESVGEGEWQRAERVLELGPDADRGLYYNHRQAPKVSDWDDDAEQLEALEFAYGDGASWANLDRKLAEIRKPQTRQDDALRYFHNRRSVADRQWIDPAAWNELEDQELELEDGAEVTLGFDGSLFHDATALVACTEAGALFLLEIWEEPEAAAAKKLWKVPVDEVDAAVAGAFERLEVVRLYADPPHYRDSLSRWAKEFGERRVVEWSTFSDARMAPACERFHTAVADGSGIAHNGDATLGRHVANARIRRTRRGPTVQKEHPKSSRKIDAAVAAILAYEARGDALAAREFNRRRRRGRAYSFN